MVEIGTGEVDDKTRESNGACGIGICESIVE